LRAELAARGAEREDGGLFVVALGAGGTAASFVGSGSWDFASEEEPSCAFVLESADEDAVAGAEVGEDFGGISAVAEGAPANAAGGPNCGAVGSA